MYQLIAEVVHRGMEQFFCFNLGYPMDIDFKCRRGIEQLYFNEGYFHFVFVTG
jgi:hypothetical protein